jgi:hypothetical protein
MCTNAIDPPHMLTHFFLCTWTLWQSRKLNKLIM